MFAQIRLVGLALNIASCSSYDYLYQCFLDYTKASNQFEIKQIGKPNFKCSPLIVIQFMDRFRIVQIRKNGLPKRHHRDIFISILYNNNDIRICIQE